MNIQIWNALYATLTTTQIKTALRSAGLNHKDWMKMLDDIKIKSTAAATEVGHCPKCHFHELTPLGEVNLIEYEVLEHEDDLPGNFTAEKAYCPKCNSEIYIT